MAHRLDPDVIAGLRSRVIAHNEAVGAEGKRTRLQELKKVYQQSGMDAVDQLLNLRKAEFDDNEHPRDANGRFTQTYSNVRTTAQHQRMRQDNAGYRAQTTQVIPESRYSTTLAPATFVASLAAGAAGGAVPELKDASLKGVTRVARGTAGWLGGIAGNAVGSIASLPFKNKAAIIRRGGEYGRRGSRAAVGGLMNLYRKVSVGIPRAVVNAASKGPQGPGVANAIRRGTAKVTGRGAGAVVGGAMAIPAGILLSRGADKVAPFLDSWFPRYVEKLDDPQMQEVLAKAGATEDELQKITSLGRFANRAMHSSAVQRGAAILAGGAIGAIAGGAAGYASGKGNPYHDEKGRFTSKERAIGGAVAGAALGAGAGYLASRAIARRQILSLAERVKNGYSRPFAYRAKDGSVVSGTMTRGNARQAKMTAAENSFSSRFKAKHDAQVSAAAKMADDAVAQMRAANDPYRYYKGKFEGSWFNKNMDQEISDLAGTLRSANQTHLSDLVSNLKTAKSQKEKLAHVRSSQLSEPHKARFENRIKTAYDNVDLTLDKIQLELDPKAYFARKHAAYDAEIAYHNAKQKEIADTISSRLVGPKKATDKELSDLRGLFEAHQEAANITAGTKKELITESEQHFSKLKEAMGQPGYKAPTIHDIKVENPFDDTKAVSFKKPMTADEMDAAEKALRAPVKRIKAAMQRGKDRAASRSSRKFDQDLQDLIDSAPTILPGKMHDAYMGMMARLSPTIQAVKTEANRARRGMTRDFGVSTVAVGEKLKGAVKWLGTAKDNVQRNWEKYGAGALAAGSAVGVLDYQNDNINWLGLDKLGLSKPKPYFKMVNVGRPDETIIYGATVQGKDGKRRFVHAEAYYTSSKKKGSERREITAGSPVDDIERAFGGGGGNHKKNDKGEIELGIDGKKMSEAWNKMNSSGVRKEAHGVIYNSGDDGFGIGKDIADKVRSKISGNVAADLDLMTNRSLALWPVKHRVKAFADVFGGDVKDLIHAGDASESKMRKALTDFHASNPGVNSGLMVRASALIYASKGWKMDNLPRFNSQNSTFDATAGFKETPTEVRTPRVPDHTLDTWRDWLNSQNITHHTGSAVNELKTQYQARIALGDDEATAWQNAVDDAKAFVIDRMKHERRKNINAPMSLADAPVDLLKADGIAMMALSKFDESKIVRQARGSDRGGEFASKGGPHEGAGEVARHSGGEGKTDNRSYFEPVRLMGTAGSYAGMQAAWDIAEKVLPANGRAFAKIARGAERLLHGAIGARLAAKVATMTAHVGTFVPKTVASIAGGGLGQLGGEALAGAGYRAAGRQAPPSWQPPERPAWEEVSRGVGSIGGWMAGSTLGHKPASKLVLGVIGGMAGEEISGAVHRHLSARYDPETAKRVAQAAAMALG